MTEYAKFEALMNSKKVKVSDVAEATGISPSTFSDWKNGKSVPKTDKMYLIARYLGVHIEDLLRTEEKVEV